MLCWSVECECTCEWVRKGYSNAQPAGPLVLWARLSCLLPRSHIHVHGFNSMPLSTSMPLKRLMFNTDACNLLVLPPGADHICTHRVIASFEVLQLRQLRDRTYGTWIETGGGSASLTSCGLLLGSPKLSTDFRPHGGHIVSSCKTPLKEQFDSNRIQNDSLFFVNNKVLYFRTLQTMHLPMASPPLFSLTIPKQQQQQQQQIMQLHPRCLLSQIVFLGCTLN